MVSRNVPPALGRHHDHAGTWGRLENELPLLGREVRLRGHRLSDRLELADRCAHTVATGLATVPNRSIEPIWLGRAAAREADPRHDAWE